MKKIVLKILHLGEIKINTNRAILDIVGGSGAKAHFRQ